MDPKASRPDISELLPPTNAFVSSIASMSTAISRTRTKTSPNTTSITKSLPITEDSCVHLNAPSTKRKRPHGAKPGETSSSIKRQKVIGRPRNKWTPTRLRKLIRLYMMTELRVEEIVRVLRSKDFMPGDVQKRIKDHFPRRDSRQVREQGKMPKLRLQVARECRALKSIKTTLPVHGTMNQIPKELNSTPFPQELDKVGTEAQLHETFESSRKLPEIYPPTNYGNEQGVEINPLTSWFIDSSSQVSYHSAEFTGTLSDQPLTSHCSQNLTNVSQTTSLITPQSSGRTETSKNFDSHNLVSDLGPSLLADTVAECIADEVSSEANIFPVTNQALNVTSKDSPGYRPSYSLRNNFNTTPKGLPDEENINAPRTAAPSVEKSHELSIHIKDDLKTRLPGKTESFVDDVWSALQNLTVTEISTRSRMTRMSRAISNFSVPALGTILKSRALHDVYENGESSSTPKHRRTRLRMPGDNAADIIRKAYWIDEKRYRRKQRGRFKDEPGDLVTIINCQAPRIEVQGSQHQDTFGHTLLHTVARLRDPPSFLTKLVGLGINVHATNSANETLLHLVDNLESDSFEWALLGLLKRAGYNFNGRNCLGQTALHTIIKDDVGKQRLELLLATLEFWRIPLPQSRDNFGSTIMSQLRQAGVDETTIQDSLLETTKIGGPRWTSGTETPMTTVLPNYGDHINIINFEDMCLYDHHRALVQTITKAHSHPGMKMMTATTGCTA